MFQERQVPEQTPLEVLERLAERSREAGNAGAAGRYLRLAVVVGATREAAQRRLRQSRCRLLAAYLERRLP